MAAPKGQTISSTPTINHCRGLREELETLISSVFINNYCRCLRKGLEFLTSSIFTNNYCRGHKEELRIQPVSTTSISFINSSNISDITSSSIKPPKTGYALWHRHCRCSRIKNLTPAACSLCKYI